MAFAVGNTGRGVRPAMNVTPLVDVVLVLLIIFMVVTPLLTKQFWLHVPKKDDAAQAAAPPPDDEPPMILSVRSDGSIHLGPEVIAESALEEKLRRVLVGRRDRTVFFGADPDVPFDRAMQVLDRARGSGVATLAVLTEPLK